MKVEDILSYEKLHELYVVKKFSDSEIADKFDLTLGQVHRLRNKYLIKAIEQYERHPKARLDEQEVNLIVGLLLGDGHLRLRDGSQTYPSLIIEQSAKHREYLFWLFEALKDWLPDPNKYPRQAQHRNGDKVYHSYTFSTVSHPAFFQLYHAFYKNGKKSLDMNFINEHFNIISLAVWLQDDGSLTGTCKRNILYTNSFTKDEVNALRDMLNRKFGLKTWISKRTTANEVSYEIAFDRKSSVQLSDMLRNIVVPSMLYKLVPSETTNGAATK
jgi:hypothetical protein